MLESEARMAARSPAEAIPGLGGRSRNGPRPFRVAKHELAERVWVASRKASGSPPGGHRAEAVAIAAGIFGGDQALLARDPDEGATALGEARRRERRIELAGAAAAASQRSWSWSSSRRSSARREGGARRRRRRPRRAGQRSSSLPSSSGAGRDRGRGPAPALRREACRPRTCRSRCQLKRSEELVGGASPVSTSTRSSQHVGGR